MGMANRDIIEQIICGDAKKLVAEAKALGGSLKKKELTTSQIRNVFGSIKKMEMKGFKENELLLLKPKLAYAANKPGAKQGIRDLREILSMAVDCVGDSDDKFENFYNFFEAILAYHAAGGK